jgi:hypothetical protein
MSDFSPKNGRPYRLRLSSTGLHSFGGAPMHRGVTPAKTDTPLHLLLTLDLSDEHCPIETESQIRRLPFYFPLKYGFGGPELQYDVVSDEEIKIIYLSDAAANDVDQQYVQVAELPTAQEEARILGFAGGYFQPNEADAALLAELNRPHPLVRIGGYRRLPQNAGDVICRNQNCEFFNRRVRLDVLATIPPIPVDGDDRFWHEFQGAHMEFYFCSCKYCKTVIAFNVSC